jgi:hypothetical protein
VDSHGAMACGCWAAAGALAWTRTFDYGFVAPLYQEKQMQHGITSQRPRSIKPIPLKRQHHNSISLVDSVERSSIACRMDLWSGTPSSSSYAGAHRHQTSDFFNAHVCSFRDRTRKERNDLGSGPSALNACTKVATVIAHPKCAKLLVLALR